MITSYMQASKTCQALLSLCCCCCCCHPLLMLSGAAYLSLDQQRYRLPEHIPCAGKQHLPSLAADLLLLLLPLPALLMLFRRCVPVA
jgi:hypothetical protein